jgi:3-hydroxyacyl-[acyl-carrier-protein] dehydratase
MRFILIDRIERLEAGRRAEGYKLIRPDEEYFRDHFPGYPVVPGVLILESLAQLGGRLVEHSEREASGRRILPLLGKVEQAKFVRSVRPGDRLDLAVDVVAIAQDAARVTGVASVGGRKVATAAIMYAIVDPERADMPAGGPEPGALHAWSDRVWRQLRGETQ